MGWLSKCITQSVTAGVFILIVTVIWIELAVGLVATTYTVFFKDDKAVEVLPFLIFTFYASCVAATLFFTVRSTWERFHLALHYPTVNWFSLGMTTVDTLVIFGVIFGYTHVLAENQHADAELGWIAAGLFVMIFFGIKIGFLMYLIQRKKYSPILESAPEKEEILP